MALIPIVENKKKSLGIYVHIPFCRSKCEYCDFYSIPGARSRDLMDRYLDAVILHIREAAQGAAGYEVDTVYFGGGTPSFFGAGGLAKIFAEIDRRFDDPELSVAALAAQTGWSEVYFRRAFRAAFGTSPLAYIRRVRLENAKALLRTGYYSITETATRCGFDSVSYFSYTFRRETGVTPSAYRERFL